MNCRCISVAENFLFQQLFKMSRNKQNKNIISISKRWRHNRFFFLHFLFEFFVPQTWWDFRKNNMFHPALIKSKTISFLGPPTKTILTIYKQFFANFLSPKYHKHKLYLEKSCEKYFCTKILVKQNRHQWSISSTCLRTAFSCEDPKSTKRQSSHQCLFLCFWDQLA